jgi:hypothetical protein
MVKMEGHRNARRSAGISGEVDEEALGIGYGPRKEEYLYR